MLVGIENLCGSDFGDVLMADDAANRLYGLSGNDRLSGGPATTRCRAAMATTC